LFFILVLENRTLYSVEKQKEFNNKFVNSIKSVYSNLKNPIDENEINAKNPVCIPLEIVPSAIYLVDDLKIRLVLNKTKTDFVASDNPVVFYNQFLERRVFHGGNTGLGSKGLQIFFPISPKQLMIFYDSDVYNVGNTKKDILEISKEEDILKLNGLQFINANKNLFFNENVSFSYFEKLKNYYNVFFRNNKWNLQEFCKNGKNNNSEGYLLYMSTEELKCDLSLKFIQILNKAKKYEVGKEMVHLRNEELFKMHLIFLDKVNLGLYKPMEFYRFLNDECQHGDNNEDFQSKINNILFGK
jgi:hypothetical protein